MSRCGSSVLAMTAILWTRPLVLLSRRALSVSPPLQLNSWIPRPDVSPPNVPLRKNPLVGNYSQPPPPPSRKPAKDQHSEQPAQPASVSPPLSSPPPPPDSPSQPPPATTAAVASVASSAQTIEAEIPPPQPKTVNKSYAYSATKADENVHRKIEDVINMKYESSFPQLTASELHKLPQIYPKAVTGRTVFIQTRHVPHSAPNIEAAIRVIARISREQKIKSKYFSQKFHERKGLRRKRLRSQRWRERFNTGFKAALSRVLALKKQGW